MYQLGLEVRNLKYRPLLDTMGSGTYEGVRGNSERGEATGNRKLISF